MWPSLMTSSFHPINNTNSNSPYSTDLSSQRTASTTQVVVVATTTPSSPTPQSPPADSNTPMMLSSDGGEASITRHIPIESTSKTTTTKPAVAQIIPLSIPIDQGSSSSLVPQSESSSSSLAVKPPDSPVNEAPPIVIPKLIPLERDVSTSSSAKLE